MALRIYLNCCDEADYHAGVEEGDVVSIDRTLPKFSTQRIEAYVEVKLDSNAPYTWQDITIVVKDGLMALSGKIVDNTVLSTRTPTGEFELLTNPGYPRTLNTIMETLKLAYKDITNPHVKII